MTEVKVPVECYTRCVGYFRPVSQFNVGKKEEHRERVYYKLPEEVKNEVNKKDL